MKKVTYINFKGEKVTIECIRVSHYKNYVKLDFNKIINGKVEHWYEDVKYENIIKEEN